MLQIWVQSLLLLLVNNIALSLAQQTRPDFVNIIQQFGISDCYTKIETQEAKCHSDYLSPIAELAGKHNGPHQESDEYKKIVCCSLWNWFDCTLMAAMDHNCQDADIQTLQAFPKSNTAYTAYCVDYPYGSYRCWKFPLWAVILCGVTLGLVIIGALWGIWFWRTSKITYWRHRRRY